MEDKMNHKATKYSLVLIVLLLTTFSLSAKSAPGLADTFYRGVTTLQTASYSETLTTTEVLDTYTETRTIGAGQYNNGNNGNLQDREVVKEKTTVKEITTSIYEQHRGVAISNGKYLGTTTVETEKILSTTESTSVGDWGSAYSVPSDTK
jgi:hypothetical protein